MNKIIEYLLPFIVAILILTMGFYLREVTREAIICAILVSIVAMVVASIMMRHIGERQIERLDDIADGLDDKITNLGAQEMEKLRQIVNELEFKTKEIREPGFTIKIPGILDVQGLIKVEESTPKEDEWIITPALRLDVDILKDPITANLKRGVKCRYIISNDELTKRRAVQLIDYWGNEGINVTRQVEFRFIDKSYVQIDLGIYDPTSFSPKAVVALPAAHELQTHPLFGYAFYLDNPDSVGYYTGMFESLWEKAKPLITEESTNEKDH